MGCGSVFFTGGGGERSRKRRRTEPAVAPGRGEGRAAAGGVEGDCWWGRPRATISAGPAGPAGLPGLLGLPPRTKPLPPPPPSPGQAAAAHRTYAIGSQTMRRGTSSFAHFRCMNDPKREGEIHLQPCDRAGEGRGMKPERGLVTSGGPIWKILLADRIQRLEGSVQMDSSI